MTIQTYSKYLMFLQTVHVCRLYIYNINSIHVTTTCKFLLWTEGSVYFSCHNIYSTKKVKESVFEGL